MAETKRKIGETKRKIGETKRELVDRRVKIPKYISTYVAERQIPAELKRIIKMVKESTMWNCILHGDNTPSMKYYEETNSVHCFGCGASMKVVELHVAFVKRFSGKDITVNESVEYLYNRYIKKSKGLITVGKLEIEYDIDELLKEAKKMKYSAGEYTEPRTSFDVSKVCFMDSILKLKDPEELKIVLGDIKTNKNGSIPKAKRLIIEKFGEIRDYNELGAYTQCTIDAIMIERVSEFTGKIVLGSYIEHR